MFRAYMDIYAAQWRFFILYGWKIFLVMIIVFVIVAWLKSR